MKKLNQEEVINRFIQTHNDKYDYSLVEYKNQRTKVKIICKEHGIFETFTNAHFIGQGCPECARVKKHTSLSFINKSNNIHNYKYDYSLVEYINNKSKVKIICKEHGIFEQRPDNHMIGQDCPKCADIDNGKNKRLSINDFTSRSNIKHNNKYDYSLVNYINTTSKVKIICKEHGIFEQTPGSHLYGRGCPTCSKEIKSLKTSWDYVKKFELNPDLGNKPGIFYIIKFKHKLLNFEFIKIGITSNDIQTRFRSYTDYEYQIIVEYKKSLLECATIEKFYKNKFINEHYSFKFPENLKFSGRTECFKMEVSNYFIRF